MEDYLCDELVLEILIRLPTPAAVRAQVVCKKWYSLVSSPHFISRFIHLHQVNRDVAQSSIIFQFNPYIRDPGHGIFLFISDGYFRIISDCSSLRTLYGECTFQLSYLPCPPEQLVLECSFADLILCSHLRHTNHTNYYISNPLTRKWFALPPTPTPTPSNESVFIGFLCFDRKFMVVRLFSDKFKVQLFSSDDCQWRTLDVSSSLPFESHDIKTGLVAYRGMLHWLHYHSRCIVVYDPLNTPKSFHRLIQLPNELLLSSHWELGVSQGRLRVGNISDAVLDVWELDYDSGLWHLAYKVHLHQLIHSNGLLESEWEYFFLLSFHPENGDVIYLRTYRAVVLLNMKSRIIESYYPITEDGFEPVIVCQLVDQWWPTIVSSLH